MNKQISALIRSLEALDHMMLFTSLKPGFDGRVVDEAYKAINKALAEQPAQQQELGVKGYAMALNEIALKLRERYKTDLLSTPLWAEFEKARNKFATSIASPPAQPKGLTDEQAHQTLLDMAAHIEDFGNENTTDEQLSGECIRFILERVIASGTKGKE